MKWYIGNIIITLWLGYLAWAISADTRWLGLLLAVGCGYSLGSIVYMWKFHGLLNEMEELHKDIMAGTELFRSIKK